MNNRVYTSGLSALVLGLLLGLTAAATARAEAPLPVVASFSILGDLVDQVGGERVAVTTLVGPGGDAHVYEPTPADARRVGQAALLVTNGLGFEGWIDRLVEASGFSGPKVVAAADVTPRRADPEGPGAHGGDIDPHAWQNPTNVALYVARIRDGLIQADPADAAGYRARAEAYLAALAALDGEIRAVVAAIPPARRKVVTSHDAFGYFGDAYGLAFLAPVGVNTEAEASAADVVALIRQIRAESIPAVFVENISDPRLLDQIRRETGAQPGGTLYSDALSPPEGPAGTYLDLMRHNLATLAANLTPGAASGGAPKVGEPR
jgi:zinc/manganese transport system substrate-binding protein